MLFFLFFYTCCARHARTCRRFSGNGNLLDLQVLIVRIFWGSFWNIHSFWSVAGTLLWLEVYQVWSLPSSIFNSIFFFLGTRPVKRSTGIAFVLKPLAQDAQGTCIMSSEWEKHYVFHTPPYASWAGIAHIVHGRSVPTYHCRAAWDQLDHLSKNLLRVENCEWFHYNNIE